MGHADDALLVLESDPNPHKEDESMEVAQVDNLSSVPGTNGDSLVNQDEMTENTVLASQVWLQQNQIITTSYYRGKERFFKSI